MFKCVMLYRWNSILEPVIFRNMENIIEKCVLCDKKIENIFGDGEASDEIMRLIHKEHTEAIFTLDYYPLLSMIAEVMRIPYIAWIYDNPHYTAHSIAARRKYTFLFCFDKEYTEQLRNQGVNWIMHYPLAADCELFQSVNILSQNSKDYQSEISFVGNLYNSDRNKITRANLNEYTRGYVEGIIRAQQKIYGVNLVKESLNDIVIQEIQEKCDLRLSDYFEYPVESLVADAINVEISSRDRQEVIGILASNYKVDLYCKSVIPEKLSSLTGLKHRGNVSYFKEMPIVFANSSINLNITARGITSGIPQRVIDILGSGGFCLTNYQPEIAEYFDNGKELVMYSDIEEIVDLTEYYLRHESERKRIAQSGYQKVKTEFNMEQALKNMLLIVEKEIG